MALSPYLKREFDLLGFHNLEVFLHLTDGFQSGRSKFRWNAPSDVTLVNKFSDMLIEEMRIPENWFQVPNKWLVFNMADGLSRVETKKMYHLLWVKHLAMISKLSLLFFPMADYKFDPQASLSFVYF